MSDKELIEGMWFNLPHENAPDFVNGNISIDLERFAPWVKAWKAKNPNKKYLKIALKTSKGGDGYAEEDTWEPGQGSGKPDAPKDDFVDDDIPF